jgi:tetratricopeptide (TPR) repeat protein
MYNKKQTGPTPKQNKMIQDAIVLHQSGQLDLAEAQYKKLLNLLPSNTVLLTNLGTIALQRGHLEDAVRVLRRALQINPNQVTAHYNCGKALHELKRSEEALESYNRTIALKPDFVEALNNRGLLLKNLNLLDEALTSFDKAIEYNVSYSDAYYNRGNILKDLHRFDEALESYDRVITLKPNDPAVYYNRGNTLQELKRFDEALLSYDCAIVLKPDSAETYLNRGNALQDLKRFDEALESYCRVIFLKPDYAAAYYNRGNALKELKRLDEALVNYDLAIASNPDYPEAYCNRGITLQDLKRLDDALVSYDRAILLKSDHVAAYSNRGNVLKYLYRLDEALASYDIAIALAPSYAEPYWNKALLKISIGRYKEGWDLYEWRWKKEDFTSKPLITSRPKWTGDKNKRVLVWAEQGIGDELMFGALLSEFKELCSRLLVKVDARLIPLLSRSLAKDIIFISKNESLSENVYDEHLSIGSLCQYLRNQEESFEKTRQGYLLDDKVKTEQMKESLSNDDSDVPAKKLCGISWRSKNEKTGANRSMDLKDFIGMLGLENYTYVSLQYGDTAEEIDRVRAELGINIIAYEKVDNFTDIDGLASLIQACDVVVSVDNTTVHLAGTLGKDVRVLLPYTADWRWQLNRSDSPWYSSVKLYRQNSDYQWRPVFDQVRLDLMLLD